MDNQTAAPVAAPQPLLCVVNRHQGYPPESPSYKLGDVCELPDTEQTRSDIKIGYLIPATVEHPLFTPELAKRVVAFRKCKEAESAPVQTSTLQAATAADEQAARALAEQAQLAADTERRDAVAAILNGTGGHKPVLQAPVTALPDAAVEPAAAIAIAPASGGEESPAADVETAAPSSRKR